MGFWARIFGRERPDRTDENFATATMEREFDAEGKPISVRRVEVPIRKTREELIQELEKSYQEVVDLVGKVKSHLDRHESRSGRLMEILERVDTLQPHIAGLSDRFTQELTEHAERVTTAIDSGREQQDRFGRRLEELMTGLDEGLRHGVSVQTEMSTALTDMQSNLLSVAQSGKQSSTALQSLLQRQDERNKELGELIVRARRSFTVALYVGLAMGAIALAVASLALMQAFSST